MSGQKPAASVSPAVKAGGLIYVAGTFAEDASGAIVDKGDVAAQTQRVIERLRETLVAAGSSLEQAVAVTVFLKSQSDFAAMNAAYRGYWATHPPTRTTVVTDLVRPGALIEMSLIAVPNGAERVVIRPESWIKSPNPYSYAIRSGDLLFLAGLVSRNGRDNSAVPGDVSVQTRTILDNAGALLTAAGMTHANVVSAKIYMPDLAPFQQMNEAYRAVFSAAPPARATVRATLPGPQNNVEITMVASAAKKEVIADGRPANPNLSAAIRAGNRVFVSGMLGNTPENEGDAAAQTTETLSRIDRALQAAGCSRRQVVEAVVYLPDVKWQAAVAEPYLRFFGPPDVAVDGIWTYPANTVVGAGLVVPDGLVEIMVSAECGAGQ